MYYAMVVEICNGGERCADEVCSVRFVVAPFSTYSIEKFSTEGKVSYKVYWVEDVSSVIPFEGLRRALVQLFIVSK